MNAKRIIALLVALMLVFSLSTLLSACGEDEPTVNEPTTEDPTEEEPTEEEPTEDPTTDEPTTEEPTTEEPTTEDPEDSPPTTEDPTEEEPTVEDPTTEEPTEDPTVEEPTTEDPTEEEPTTEEPTVEDPTTEDSGEVILVDNSVTKFKFVVADGMSSDINMTVGKLVSELAKYGVDTEVLFDNQETLTSCEVLIGTVKSRGDEYKLDPHVYGWEGYTIKIIGNKILILGGSEDSLNEAIEVFKKDILGINKKTKKITNAKMTSEQNVEKIQDDYTVKSVTIAESNLNSYKIVASADERTEYATAKSVQELLYKKLGTWLDIVAPASEYTNAIVIDLTNARDCISDKGFVLNISNGNILIDCGFENKIEEACLAFFMTEITNSGKTDVSFVNNYKYEKVDYRNIYYKDYGAKGDGYTDDFMAVKACHDYANLYGHTVHATSSDTYYFGKGSGFNTIYVRTDTYWHGCKFIFDDSEIKAPERDSNGNHTGVEGDPEYYTSIFSLTTGKEVYDFTGSKRPFTTLYEGATEIGYAPGYRALIKVYNANLKQFIRYGANADSGFYQQEILMVEADGTIDPTTPVQWSYDTVTGIEVHRRDDDPIILSGGENGKQALIETIFNGAPSYYDYYDRNISVVRANAVIENIKHIITGEADSPTGAPYNGFINIDLSDNIVVSGCEFQCPKGYKTMGTGGEMASMGTYELHANSSNNILWKDCTQSNFYRADGSVPPNGMMGTNFCKNLYFDNMFVCSFDAHKGTYNATLKNSTCEHINFIGEGTITLENVVMYVGPKLTGLVFRSDYGSTWQGDVVIDGLDLRYPHDMDSQSKQKIQLIKSVWTNHDFGYITYLPHTITMKNVTTSSYTYSVDGMGNRTETKVDVNKAPLHLYIELEGYKNIDISNPNANMSSHPNDSKPCTCEAGYTDVDENQRCDKCKLPETVNRDANANPFMPTEKVYVEDCPGLVLIFPNTPQFKNMKVYVEGEEVDWQVTGTIRVPD